MVLLSFAFKPIGGLLIMLWNNINDTINFGKFDKMKEARCKHRWITVQGANSVVTKE